MGGVNQKQCLFCPKLFQPRKADQVTCGALVCQQQNQHRHYLIWKERRLAKKLKGITTQHYQPVQVVHQWRGRPANSETTLDFMSQFARERQQLTTGVKVLGVDDVRDVVES